MIARRLGRAERKVKPHLVRNTLPVVAGLQTRVFFFACLLTRDSLFLRLREERMAAFTVSCCYASAIAKEKGLMKTFEGKVVIVTGGSSGIGAAAALQFAREGAKVVIAARRNDKSEAVVRQISALGGEGLFIQTDVTKRADIEALVEGTLARFGRLDCALNNAGIAGPVSVPVAEITEESWDALMNINLKGVWLCMKY